MYRSAQTQSQELAFQMSVKPVPWLLSGPGWISTLPEEFTRVSFACGKTEMLPEVDPAFALAPVICNSPKSGIGLVPFLWTTHSALELSQPAQVSVLIKLFPGLVESM